MNSTEPLYEKGVDVQTYFENWESLFSDQQVKILVITGIITAVPSLIGSGLIIYSILKEKEYKKRIYQRIMLGLSCMDSIVSADYVFMVPWSVPKQVSFVWGAKGNFFTCSLSGFFAHMAIGTLFYTAFLALFFCLLVSYGLEEKNIKKWFEPIIHTISIGFPVVTGVFAVSKQYMNPNAAVPGICWLGAYCDDEVCRGLNINPFPLVCGTYTAIFTFLVVLFSMARIVCEVYQTEKKLRVYFTENDGCPPNDGVMVLTRETCVKALLYIGTYFLTFIGIAVLQISSALKEMSKKNRTHYFVWAMITKIFFPLQGFFNCCIYFRYKTPSRPLRMGPARHANIMAFTEPHRRPPISESRQSVKFSVSHDEEYGDSNAITTTEGITTSDAIRELESPEPHRPSPLVEGRQSFEGGICHDEEYCDTNLTDASLILDEVSDQEEEDLSQ